MSDSGNSVKGTDALVSEAVYWLVQLTSGEATHADREALNRWRSQSPAHAEALREATQLWTDLKPAAIAAERSFGRPAAGMLRQGGRRPLGRRAFLGATLAASAAAAGYLVVNPPMDLWPTPMEVIADYRTAVGEQRKITMGNALSIQMNTATSLNIRPQTGNAKLIELISGEAAVTQIADGEASITLASAGCRVTATQAVFSLRRTGDAGAVTCTSGEVSVEYKGRQARLEAGQRLAFNAGSLQTVTAVDPVIAEAWRQGLLIFRNAPLSHVIEEVNRYRKGRIILIDASLDSRVVNARFKLDHLDDVIVQINQALNVQVRTLPGGVVLVG